MTITSIALRLALLTLCLSICAANAQADVKIKSKSTSGGQTTEQVVYIKGKRQRTELNPATVSIMQCDLRRTIDIGVPTQTYMISPFDQKTVAPASHDAATGATPPSNTTTQRRGGLITTTITTTDTGERKQMFGYTARHIKTVMVTESSPEACQQTRSRMEMDGWYIDATFALDCADRSAAAYVPQARPDGCQDQHRMKQIGTARTGYPVAVTTTMFDEQGKSSFTWTQEVVEISKATLEDALFDVPAGYREVRDRQEMYSAAAMMSSLSNDANDDDAEEASNNPTRRDAQGAGGGMAASVRTQANSQTAPATTLGAKREGVMRVGVVATKTGAVGEGINAAMLGEAVRNTLINYLTGPAIEVVALEARLPQQAALEAQQKECDFVLYTTVAHKKGGGGGGFGGFLRKAAPVVDVMPMGSGASSVVADVAVRTTIYTASDFATSVKAKDELTFDYQLQRAVDGSAVVGQTLKAKAKSNGEDLVSQLVEQAASAVLTGAARR